MEAQSSSLPQCVQDYIHEHCHDGQECAWCEHLTFLIEDPVNGRPVTSVPEQLFIAAWLHIAYDPIRYGLNSQVRIGKYFADFTVSGFDHFVNDCHFNATHLEIISSLLPRYAIEIDGFEWHDRTPEQAEKERKRARFIQSQGYTVLRFAAREVLRNPNECVREISRNRVFPDIQAVYARITIHP